MKQSSEIWTGEAQRYDQTRPSPPPVLATILTQMIHTPYPALVVDLGSGSGLSTMLWLGQAQHVIGIEPNTDMRQRAQQKLKDLDQNTSIEYREGTGEQTGLPENSADIVTCAQSFHWMEPVATLKEIARILRPGGVFAAYDYEWPPVISWEVEQVYEEVEQRFTELERQRPQARNLQRWSKDEHLQRMRASGHFQFTREFLLHHREQGNATRFIDMVLTNAYGHQFKQQTIREEEIGFQDLRLAASQYIGEQPVPWYLSYKVRIGIK